MPIKSVEIICKPCRKCENLRSMIREVVRGLVFQNHVKISYDFKHNSDLRSMERFSLNPSQTPVILINGNVEFAGRINDLRLLRLKFDAINKGY